MKQKLVLVFLVLVAFMSTSAVAFAGRTMRVAGQATLSGVPAQDLYNLAIMDASTGERISTTQLVVTRRGGIYGFEFASVEIPTGHSVRFALQDNLGNDMTARTTEMTPPAFSNWEHIELAFEASPTAVDMVQMSISAPIVTPTLIVAILIGVMMIPTGLAIKHS